MYDCNLQLSSLGRNEVWMVHVISQEVFLYNAMHVSCLQNDGSVLLLYDEMCIQIAAIENGVCPSGSYQ